jgi:hypothetical protein
MSSVVETSLVLVIGMAAQGGNSERFLDFARNEKVVLEMTT